MSLESNKKDYSFEIKNSLLNNSWIKRVTDQRMALHISQKYSLSPLAINLLLSRCSKLEDIKNFLEPNLNLYLSKSFIFHDMKKAVNRVFLALKKKEIISIIGDYDVDGLSSIVILKKFFKFLNISINSYIPDRIKEGYGPNKKAIDELKSKRTSLLFMVDCGTNAGEIISYAKNKGIDVIVIDHHKSNEQNLETLALLNPNTINDKSGFNYLCATGLTFIFLNYLQKLLKSNNYFPDQKFNLYGLLDLVALATVCDIVPLVHLNRAFVLYGLEVLHKRQNLGLKLLADESMLNKKPDEEDLGFFFGPRINAGGRIGKSDIGEKLLNAEEETEAELLVKQLNTLNYQRKLIEEKVYKESIEQINDENKLQYNSLLLISNNWHEGVLGIVASRLKDKFNRPTIILTKNKETYKGSGRSIPGIDMGGIILQAKQKNIILKGGGHQMAAGLTIKSENIKIFQKFFEEFVQKNKTNKEYKKDLIIDETLSISAINDELIDAINKIAPFGPGNSKPKFLFRDVKIIKPKIVGETKQHLSFILIDQGGNSIKGIAFHTVDNLLGKTILTNYKKNLFSFVGFIKKSMWKNKRYFEIIIEDGVLAKHII